MKHNTSFLFLRGLGRNQYHWGDHEKFYKAFGQDCHFLDLPGCGENIEMDSPNTVEGISDFLHQKWKQLGVPESRKKILVGLSLGGMVSLDWVKRYPEEWDGLVLINSSVKDLSPFWDRLRFQNYISVLKILLIDDPTEREEIIFDMTCNLSNKEQTLKWWLEIQKKYPVTMDNMTTQLAAASKYRSPKGLPKKLKTLVLTSKKDRLVSFRCSKAIAKKYKSNLVIHKKAGHDLAVDDWTWCSEMITDWLENPWMKK